MPDRDNEHSCARFLLPEHAGQEASPAGGSHTDSSMPRHTIERVVEPSMLFAGDVHRQLFTESRAGGGTPAVDPIPSGPPAAGQPVRDPG